MRATALVAALCIALVTGVAAQCDTSTTCSSCIAQGSCGWCEGSCVQGTGDGSNNGACSSVDNNWYWTTCPSVSQCQQQTSCSDCTSQSNCGWCNGECLDGTNAGSNNEECKAGDGDWYWGSCSSTVGCSVYDECSTCTSDDNCGWCDGSCVAGTSSGANDGECSASSGNWNWDTCSADCSALYSCDSCTDTAGCGWCSASSECLAGNSYGPTSYTCSGADDDNNGAWQYDSCADCSLYTDCSSCTDEGSCGWCQDTGTCMFGQSGGSADSTCTGSDWSWFSSSCCSDNYDCSDCTDNMNCGWCSGSDSCYSGDYFGPNGINDCFDGWQFDNDDCETTWSPGGFGFVFVYIILPVLCFIVCVRGCVFLVFRRRRRAAAYRPLNTPAVVVNNTATVAAQPAPAYAPSGAYTQSVPPQQVPPPTYQAAYQPAAASASNPPYYNTSQPAYQASYQYQAPANNYSAQPSAPYQPSKNELPPPS